MQPLLPEEVVRPKPDEVEQIKQEVEVQESQQAEEFTRLEDDLWMHREVLLEVPVSVSPQVEPQSPTPPVSATSVTEEERRADCLCFPAWSSSEKRTEVTGQCHCPIIEQYKSFGSFP